MNTERSLKVRTLIELNSIVLQVVISCHLVFVGERRIRKGKAQNSELKAEYQAGHWAYVRGIWSQSRNPGGDTLQGLLTHVWAITREKKWQRGRIWGYLFSKWRAVEFGNCPLYSKWFLISTWTQYLCLKINPFLIIWPQCYAVGPAGCIDIKGFRLEVRFRLAEY